MPRKNAAHAFCYTSYEIYCIETYLRGLQGRGTWVGWREVWLVGTRGKGVYLQHVEGNWARVYIGSLDSITNLCTCSHSQSFICLGCKKATASKKISKELVLIVIRVGLAWSVSTVVLSTNFPGPTCRATPRRQYGHRACRRSGCVSMDPTHIPHNL